MSLFVPFVLYLVSLLLNHMIFGDFFSFHSNYNSRGYLYLLLLLPHLMHFTKALICSLPCSLWYSWLAAYSFWQIFLLLQRLLIPQNNFIILLSLSSNYYYYLTYLQLFYQEKVCFSSLSKLNKYK